MIELFLSRLQRNLDAIQVSSLQESPVQSLFHTVSQIYGPLLLRSVILVCVRP